jgi:hypothetical protein
LKQSGTVGAIKDAVDNVMQKVRGKVMKTIKLMMLTPLFVGLISWNAAAVNFGDNITIPDRMVGGNPVGWWGASEENEVEPGVGWKGQSFDLEGFVFDGAQLAIVGGYNFWAPPSRTQMLPGDIFIDVDGDAFYGTPAGVAGNAQQQNIWGYDFVYDINYVNNTYDIYAIDSTTYLRSVLYGTPGGLDNRGSTAWRYNPMLYPQNAPIFSGALNYWNNLGDADLTDYGFLGAGNYYDATYVGTHYAIQVDLLPLGLSSGTDFLAHYTMQCGNDSLVGRGVITPDGGATLALLGAGLLGMAFLRRRSR